MPLNTLEVGMAIPAVTREYSPGSCRNLRKPMKLHPHPEMRPESPALGVEQFCVPSPTSKEPQFASPNSRESPRRPSHVQKDTDVTAEN